MNKATLLIAVSCLVAGLAAGALVVTMQQESASIVQLPLSSKTTVDAKAQDTLATTQSPFAVIEEPGIKRNLDTGTPQLPSAINYTSLSDYHHLLATLNLIDDADASLIKRWIDSAPALSLAPSLSRDVNRALFQKLSELQPASTVAWIEQRSENLGMFREDALLNDAIAGYSLAQPVAAEKWLASLDPYGEQQSLVYRFTTTLGHMNPERVLAQLSATDEHSYSYEIVDTWARTDPVAALDWLENRAGNHEKEMHESTILENLMRLNPDAALAYIQDSPTDDNSAWLLARYALAEQDPQRALEWALEQNNPDVLEETMRELVWMWPEDDLGSLQARIEGLEDHALRDRILVDSASRLLSHVAEDDPSAVMAWVDSQNAAIQDELRLQAVSIWLESDPTSAIDWLRQQPDSDERAQLLQSVMWSLPEVDIELALDTFPGLKGNERISLIGPMIFAIQKNRPSILPQWVAGLTDPDAQKMASIILDDQAQLINPEQFIAELNQATGEERIDKLAVLYRSMGTVDNILFEQWLMENPLTTADERALERRFDDMYPEIDDYC